MSVLEHYKKKKDYLVCVDSDGCAMDTMDIKHFKCFGPCMVDEWGLEQWQDEILTRWNEMNLFTMTRGVNRFQGLAMMLSLIHEEYREIEDVQSLVRWVEVTRELSDRALSEEISKNESSCLKKALAWSEAVNEAIDKLPDAEKKPFPGAPEGIAAAHREADVAIVSSANQKAVEEEWERYGMLSDTDVLLSQSEGSKACCIGRLLAFGYDRDKTLMVGDAPGDAEAAAKNGVFFYPILVRKEAESWKRFENEALKRLRESSYAGEYQKKLLDEFHENLGRGKA